ncbi:MAG: alpha-2-macroglobulin family protein [Thermoplasmata archaeon]
MPYYYGEPIEIKNGTIILNASNAGLGNITFVPICDENIVKYEIIANFSDRFEHFNSESKFVYVGNVPVEGAKLTLRNALLQYLPTDDIRFDVALTVSETNISCEEIIMPLIEKSLLAELSARNQSGDWQLISSCNLVTDENGSASFNMSNFNISLNQILSNSLVHFLVKVSTNDTSVQEMNATKQFTISTREHKLSTDKTHYASGEHVNITMSITDLLSSTIPTGNYTLSIFSGTIDKVYSDYYYWMPKYYSYSYDYDYFYEACIYTHSGVLSGTKTISWHIPVGLPDGDYTIEFTFGGFSIRQKIQVITKEPINMEITAPDSFSEDDKITIEVDFSNNFDGFLYIDIITRNGIIPFSRRIDGSHTSLEFTAPFSKLPLFVYAYVFDSSGRIFEKSKMIASNFRMPELKISVNKTQCMPGDTILITASLLGEIANGSLPLFGLEIVDAALFEIEDEEEEYYYSYYYDYSEEYYEFGKDEYYPYYSYYYQRNTQAKDFFENFRYPNARYHRMLTNWNVKKINFEPLENITVRYWPEHSEKIEQVDFYNTTNWIFEDMTYAGGLAPQVTKENLRSELEKTKIREWFTDQAYWLAFMPGEDSVTLEVRLPDNICKWRISGIAVMENCIGVTSYTEINSAKEFYIEPSLPEVLTQDDEVHMKVRIYNLRDKSANVTVGIYADDWLLVRGPELKTIYMNARSVEEINFELIIKKCGERNMTLIASDFVDGRDAVKKTYKIRPNGALKTSHESGIVDEYELQDVIYYDEHIEGSEKTVLRLSAGFEGLLLDGADSLMGYPYGCTEQTMSKLLPDILLWEYYTMLGKLDYYTRKTLIEYITAGLGRLYSMQHGDFGWGWWSADSSDVWMTAYVLFGLSKAREVGFFIDSNVIQNAQSYLISKRSSDGSWQGTTWLINDRIALTSFVYYALVQSGASNSDLAPTSAYLASKWSSGNFKEPYSVAFYGLAKEKLHEPITQQVNWLLSHMTSGHWAQGSSLGGADETTGWATLLLAKAGKKAEVRSALEWLAKGRRYGVWGTTSDTIACMLAINEVLKISEPIDMLVSVFVGNNKIKEMFVTKEKMQEFRSAFDALDLTPYLGENGGLVSIRKSGKGDLFFELTTIQYLRCEVSCIYPQNINAIAGVPYEFQIVADPENSLLVDTKGLDIFIDESLGTTILSRYVSTSNLNDGPTTFTYTLVSTTDKLTFTLAYRCDAGERESGVIRKGYSAEINLSGNPLPMRSITKQVSEQVLSIGDKITVTISGFANSTSTLVDTIPFGLDTYDAGDARKDGKILQWTVSGKFSKSYKLKANSIFFDRWSRAYLLNEGKVYAVSNSLTITASKEDFALLREYSTIFPKDYQPIDVSLYIRSKSTRYYIAIEDTLPPGCSVDTTSIDPLNNRLDYLTYTQKDDKIVFFISKIEGGKTLKIRYKLLPKILGSFSTPPAKAYPMYSESEVAYSNAEMLIVNHLGAQAPPDDKGDGGLGSISRESDMNALIIIATGCAGGLLMLLLADTRQKRIQNGYKEKPESKIKKTH